MRRVIVPVIYPSLYRVIERFPELREDVLRLFYECEGFRNTCDDYNQCNEARLQEKTGIKAINSA